MTEELLDDKIRYEIVHYEDILLASNLCARAFLNSPLYLKIFQGTEEWRLEKLTWFFNLNITMFYKIQPESLYGTYDYTNINKPKLISFYFFSNSTLKEPTMWDKINAGLLLIPFYCGFDVFSRLMTTSKHFDEITLRFPPRPHFELQRMVVDPEYQGKGIGSKSLSQGIKKADELGLPIYLTTQLEINTRFYQKLGFEIALQEKFSPIGEANDECDNWVMVREPRPIDTNININDIVVDQSK